jgi:hypothetical protein
MKHAILGLLALLLAACTTKEGVVNEPPRLKSSLAPAQVTVTRDQSPTGALLTMPFLVNDKEIYGFKRGDSYSFQLDPASYTFKAYLGTQACRKMVWLEPGESYRFTLSPGCIITQEED